MSVQSIQGSSGNFCNTEGLTLQQLINYVLGMLAENPEGGKEHEEWLCIAEDLQNIQAYLKNHGQPFPDPTKFNGEPERLRELNFEEKLEVESKNHKIKQLEEELAKDPNLQTLNQIKKLEQEVYGILWG